MRLDEFGSISAAGTWQSQDVNQGSKRPKMMPETSMRLSQQKQRDIGPEQGRSVMMAGGREETGDGGEEERRWERLRALKKERLEEI